MASKQQWQTGWKKPCMILVAISLIFTGISTRMNTKPLIIPFTPKATYNSIKAYEHLGIPRLYSENVTVSCKTVGKTPPCVYLLDSQKKYNLDSTIRVGIELQHNRIPSKDNPDFLLLWMTDKQHGAAATGTVQYYGQGKYIGYLKALWTGTVTIQVAVRGTAEAYAILVKGLTEKNTEKRLRCTFQYAGYKEVTAAVFHQYQADAFSEKTHCNLTLDNYGYPLYCVKPKRKELHCTDWTQLQIADVKHHHLELVGDTEFKTMLSGISVKKLKDVITVELNPASAKSVFQSTSQCSRALFRKTWTASSPVGFYYNKTWSSTLCNDVMSKAKVATCLRNRYIRLYGDSTVRQLYMKLIQMTEAKVVSQKLAGGGLHRPSVARAENQNTTLHWSLHGAPMAYEPYYRGAARPIHVNLDLVPSNSKDIILVHVFGHFAVYHPDVFRIHIRKIAQSAKALLRRSPDVKIAVKAPHTILGSMEIEKISGMVSYLHRDILKEEFREVQNKTIFLDFWDSTVAMENKNIHPEDVVVQAFVDNFLRFACVS